MRLHVATADGIERSSFAVFEGFLTNRQVLAQELAVAAEDVAELVHAAFLRWGDDFPCHLEGSFACAVFDLEGARLLLVRDRFGTVPLYYHDDAAHKTVHFGSSVDEFLTRGVVSRTASRQAIWHYLAIGVVPQPQTILAGVLGVRPAEMVIYGLETHSVASKVWWTPVGHGDDVADLDQAAQELRTLLNQALETQYAVAPDTLLLLSGGIDSTVLLALASQKCDHPRTLTLGYDQHHADFDESSRAAMAAKAFHAKAEYVRISDWEVSKGFGRFVKAMDQPSRDGLNMFMAAQAARRSGATSVMTGLGGDELFTGYPYVMRQIAAERRSWLWGWLRGVAGHLPSRLRHNVLLPCLSRAQRLETARHQLYEQERRRVVSPEFLHDGPPFGELA